MARAAVPGQCRILAMTMAMQLARLICAGHWQPQVRQAPRLTTHLQVQIPYRWFRGGQMAGETTDQRMLAKVLSLETRQKYDTYTPSFFVGKRGDRMFSDGKCKGGRKGQNR